MTTSKSTERKTEAALLLLEAVSRRRLRFLVAAVVGHHTRLATPDTNVAELANYVSRDLERGVRKEVIRTRTAAAKAGLRTMSDEIAEVRMMLGTGAHPYRSSVINDVLQKSRADVIARNVSRDMVSKIGDGKPIDAIRAAGASLRSRIDTIATTEVSHAFNAARTRVAEDMPPPPAGERGYLRWSATLDKRTCSLCASLDGKTAPVGGTFDGYMPGAVHPRCRCIAYFIRGSGLAAA